MVEHSPTPWRVADIEHDHDILDADGKVAARAAHGNRELAALIVEAVNERDRLRDIVRRMIPGVEEAFAVAKEMGESVKGLCALRGVDSSEVDEVIEQWSSLLREAREAIGEREDGAR